MVLALVSTAIPSALLLVSLSPALTPCRLLCRLLFPAFLLQQLDEMVLDFLSHDEASLEGT